MTLEDKWNIFAVFVEPEVRRLARAAYFAGYAEALVAAGDLEGATKVMHELREGKCG
jgi:hypothetical protein